MSNLERSRNVIKKECPSKDKPPKVNWVQHATALENFSSQYKFLSSNFLFSLSTQKPRPESNDREMLSTRPMACNIKKIGTLQSSQVEKAWKALFNSQQKNKNYLRPGITAPVKNSRGNATVTEGLGSCKTLKEPSSFQRAGLLASRNTSTYQGGCNLFNDSEAGNCGSLKHTDFSSSFSIGISKVNEESNVLRENIKITSMPCSNSSLENCEASFSGVDRCADRSYVDATDDEILENIDVDQIVMSHYQAVGTPQGPVSKNMPSSANCSESNVAAFSRHTLPQELCELCKHGFKLALCPNASNHLQEIKDRLITISNELLDNAGDLSPKQFEVLRQERLLLNKQIQQLEKYLQDIGQRRSQTMTSTTPVQSFLIDTPLSRTHDGVRFDSQVHVRNEFSNYGNCNSPVSFSTTDGPNCSFAPVEREVFTPKLLDVTYIEGSGDKRWKRVDFSWSNKLEAYNRKVFGNHSFRPNQREVINATMSGYDVFVLMPTGGGKSLTYQLPALICPGLTLVVSPLVSLIQDQIMHLLQANIPAAYLSGNMEWAEQQEILRELQSDNCKYKLLYVTPEKVAKDESKRLWLELESTLLNIESLKRM